MATPRRNKPAAAQFGAQVLLDRRPDAIVFRTIPPGVGPPTGRASGVR